METIKERALGVFAIALAAALILGYLYLRNGSEYFTGTSGGVYWDHMKYCRTHHDGRQKIYNELVSCSEIQSARAYCWHHKDDTRQFGGETVSCDDILGIDPPPTGWDAL